MNNSKTQNLYFWSKSAIAVSLACVLSACTEGYSLRARALAAAKLKSVRVVPADVVNSTPTSPGVAANHVYPIVAGTPALATDPIIQGVATLLTLTSPSSDNDGDLITYTCTYTTPGMNSSDPNYVSGTPLCSTLPSLVTMNSTSVTGSASFNSSSGALTWQPTYFQRGTYRFSVVATDNNTTPASSSAAAYFVTVRENETTEKLLTSLDALFSTSASGLSSTIASSASSTSSSASSHWLNLLGTITAGNGDGDLSSFLTTPNPWSGTGKSSTTAVDPYQLSFSGTNDAMKLGTILNSSTQFAAETWIKPSVPSNVGRVIASNGGATGDGFVMRQSTTPPGRAEFIIGQKAYSYQDLILSDNPVGYWRLGETSGTVANDLSAQAKHGTYTGGYTLSQTGAILGDSNKAVSLNGSTGYVNIPSAPSNQIIGDMTLSVWLKPTNFSAPMNIIGKTNSNMPAPYDIYIATNGTVGVVRGNGAAFAASSSSLSLTAGIWNHFAVKIVGTAVAFYINGTLDPSPTSPTISVAMGDAGTPLKIGSRGDNAYPFLGAIDEVALFKYGLTATQISNHYNAGITTKYVPYPGNAILADKPLGYWRLNEKSGNIAYDLSGNGYHGTYQGGYTQGSNGAFASSPPSINNIDSASSTYFDGTSGRVAIPNTLTLPAGSPISVEFWAKVASHGDFSTFTLGNTESHRVSGNTTWNNATIYWDYGSIFGSSRLAGAYVGGLNNWVHIVMLSSGSANTWQAIYQNGSLTASAAGSTGAAIALSGGFIGGYPALPYYHQGLVQDFAIYNYMLSPTQITKHYQNSAWWFCQAQSLLNSSQWNLLSSIYNGTLASLFINGQQECSVAPGTPYSGIVAPTFVGSTPTPQTSFWQGLVSNFKIFGTTNATAPASSASVKTDFDATANRFRSVPVENIVTHGLVLNFDAANANQGTSGYGSGGCTTNTSWFDLSPSSINGTLKSFSSCSASSGWTGTGTSASPYALTFDGSTNYVDLGNPTPLPTGTSAKTLCAWAAPSNITPGPTQAMLVSYGVSTPGNMINLGLQTGGGLFAGGYASDLAPSAGFWSNNVWHNACVVYNGTQALVYGDGVLKLGPTAITWNTLPNAARIGQSAANNLFWPGAIGQVLIYNRALTINEIKQNCLAQQGRYGVSTCAAP